MAIETIKLTSKRQATFPAELCKELGVKPGDKLVLGRHIIDGKAAWVLHPPSSVDLSWQGALREFAEGKSDDMGNIRDSIGRNLGTRK